MACEPIVSIETLRNWVKVEEIDAGEREGFTIKEHYELGLLHREVKCCTKRTRS